MLLWPHLWSSRKSSHIGEMSHYLRGENHRKTTQEQSLLLIVCILYWKHLSVPQVPYQDLVLKQPGKRPQLPPSDPTRSTQLDPDEAYSRESIRIARTTRELLKRFVAAYHTFIDMEARVLLGSGKIIVFLFFPVFFF